MPKDKEIAAQLSDTVTGSTFRVDKLAICTQNFMVLMYDESGEANSYAGGDFKAVHVVCHYSFRSEN